MSGFATTWTAAVWLTRPWGQEPDDVPVIGVVNRGTKRARVIVTWFKDNGSKVQQDSFDLDPNRSTRSVLVKANAPDTGWARIVSTQVWSVVSCLICRSATLDHPQCELRLGVISVPMWRASRFQMAPPDPNYAECYVADR